MVVKVMVRILENGFVFRVLYIQFVEIGDDKIL